MAKYRRAQRNQAVRPRCGRGRCVKVCRHTVFYIERIALRLRQNAATGRSMSCWPAWIFPYEGPLMLRARHVKSIRRCFGSILGRIATPAVVGPTAETASRWPKTVKMARKSPMIPDKHGGYFFAGGSRAAVSLPRRPKPIFSAILSCAAFTQSISFSR